MGFGHQPNDDIQDGYKICRDIEPEIPTEAGKSTQKGNLLVSLSDIGLPTIDMHGDVSMWAYWANGTSSNPAQPPVTGNREINPSAFMKESTLPAEPDRELGHWSSVLPVVPRPEGVFPVGHSEGDVDPRYVAKEVVNTGPVDDYTKIKNITGANAPHGFPGLAVPVVNQDEHDLLFIPAGNMLVADHLKGGLSTKIYSCKGNAWIDLSGDQAASLDALLRVGVGENSAKVPALNMEQSGQDADTGWGPLYFSSALAYLSAVKNGPIHQGQVADPHQVAAGINPAHLNVKTNFINPDILGQDGPLCLESTYPATAEIPDPDQTIPIHFAFNSSTSEFCWYANVKTGAPSTFAKIHWNFYEFNTPPFSIYDLSQAELVTWNQTTMTFDDTGTAVWIDWTLSKAVQFETAGNDTVFIIDKIKDNVERLNITRDLYRARHCIKDAGSKITHMETVEKNLYISAICLSDELVDPPWTDTVNSAIKTNIDGLDNSNTMLFRMPKQWNLTGGRNFAFNILHGLDHGMPWYCRPIRPIRSNNTDNLEWQSAEEITGTTIAEYSMT